MNRSCFNFLYGEEALAVWRKRRALLVICYLWFVGLVFISGCEKSSPQFLSGVKDTPGTASEAFPGRATNGFSAEKAVVVMAMGQSNMQCSVHPNSAPSVSFERATGLTTINCAVGGTSINQWQLNGRLDSACLATLEKTKRKVIGVIWYQGESDAGAGMTDWDQRFTQLVAKWRQRWGNIPVVYAQLATHDPIDYPAPTWDLVKNQQASLFISNSSMVRTEDQPLMDRVHLTKEGHLEVGRRMAMAFRDLQTD